MNGTKVFNHGPLELENHEIRRNLTSADDFGASKMQNRFADAKFGVARVPSDS